MLPSLRDDSGERYRPLSRDDSGDRHRGEVSGMRRARSPSRVSDYSTALPDLEVEPSVMVDTRAAMEQEVVRTSSLDELALSSAPVAEVSTPNTVEEKREVALKEIDERRQMLNDTKAWIQNGLMTVVGVGVLTYLQTLESSM